MRAILALVLLTTLGLAPTPTLAAARLPSAQQVQAYVRDNWGDYARRIEDRGAPAAEPVALVEVDGVVCREVEGTPDCAFQVTVRLSDGRQSQQALSSSFDWTADGGIEEVIVLRHRRRTS